MLSLSAYLNERTKGTQLYFRGHRVLNALIGDLTARGLMEATDILVAGCSAGWCDGINFVIALLRALSSEILIEYSTN